MNADGGPNQAHWDSVDIDQVRDVSWLSVGNISERYMSKFHPSVDPRQAIDELLAPAVAARPEGLRGLAMVCGDMVAERTYFESRGDVRFTSIEGIDVSSESLKRAHQHMAGLPFVSRCEDANNATLEPSSIDLAVGLHGIHHIRELGSAFEQLRRALQPHGLLFMYEWIGPEFLQIPFRNAMVTRWLLRQFDDRQRTNHLGQRKGRFLQYRRHTFDPSEACASTQLVPEYLRHFESVKTVKFGGLLYPLLEGNAPNIDMADACVSAKVARAFDLEARLTESGVVKPLFMISVGRPRP